MLRLIEDREILRGVLGIYQCNNIENDVSLKKIVYVL